MTSIRKTAPPTRLPLRQHLPRLPISFPPSTAVRGIRIKPQAPGFPDRPDRQQSSVRLLINKVDMLREAVLKGYLLDMSVADVDALARGLFSVIAANIAEACRVSGIQDYSLHLISAKHDEGTRSMFSKVIDNFSRAELYEFESVFFRYDAELVVVKRSSSRMRARRRCGKEQREIDDRSDQTNLLKSDDDQETAEIESLKKQLTQRIEIADQVNEPTRN